MKFINILTVFLLFSCSTNSTKDNLDSTSNTDLVTQADEPHSKLISKNDFKNWPFTVESGILRCENGIYITFEANGIIYGVNGAAGNNKGVKDIEEIWLIDEKQKKELMDAGVPEKNAITRIDIGEVLDFGKTLCK